MVRIILMLCLALAYAPVLNAEAEEQESVVDSAIARIKNCGDPATEAILTRMKDDAAQPNPAVDHIERFRPSQTASPVVKTEVQKKAPPRKRSGLAEMLQTLKKKFNKWRNSNLELQGIIYDRTNPRAVINDKVVRAGDTVEGAKVMKIEENSVLMSLRDKKITLKMY